MYFIEKEQIYKIKTCKDETQALKIIDKLVKDKKAIDVRESSWGDMHNKFQNGKYHFYYFKTEI